MSAFATIFDVEVLSLVQEAEKTVRPLWVILTIGLLISLIAIVHAAFPTTVSQILRSYYDQAIFNQMGKGENPLSTWPAFILYILLGFSTGLFLFLAVPGLHLRIADYPAFWVYLLLSVSVMLSFALKILITRFISYVFGIGRHFRSYVRVLFLSYFNSAYLFLLSGLAISLLPRENTTWILPSAVVIVGFLLLFRVSKVALNLFSAYRFPMFYLIVYLCTLEIAPILILIKIVYL